MNQIQNPFQRTFGSTQRAEGAVTERVEPLVFQVGDEEIRITDDSYTARQVGYAGKYDAAFSALKEGQRIVTSSKKQTDRVARALSNFLKKKRKGGYTVRVSLRYPTDGLMGVWFFTKKPSKAAGNG